MKDSRRNNPGRMQSYNQARRAWRMNASGYCSRKQWKARLDYYGGKCYYCGTDGKMEMEHRVPLSRGGTNWPSNIVPACRPCNCRKGTKTEMEFCGVN